MTCYFILFKKVFKNSPLKTGMTLCYLNLGLINIALCFSGNYATVRNWLKCEAQRQQIDIQN